MEHSSTKESDSFYMSNIHTMIDNELYEKITIHNNHKLQEYKAILESAVETLKVKNMTSVIFTICFTIATLLITLMPGVWKFIYLLLPIFILIMTTSMLTKHFNDFYRTTLYLKKIDNELLKRKDTTNKRQEVLNQKYKKK